MIQSPFFSSLLPKIENSSLLFEGLWSGSKALLAAQIAKQQNRSILLITGGVREDFFFDDLSFFDPTLPLELPAAEGSLKEDPETTGRRLGVLKKLLEKKTPTVLLCPLASFLQKVAPPQALSPLFTRWEVGQTIRFEEVPQRLLALGYKREPLVSEKGSFAIRGGIVDLFPVGETTPYRIEFFSDRIEEIRSFDALEQTSTGKVPFFSLVPAEESSLVLRHQGVSLQSYLKDPLLMWDDLAAIEETFVALKSLPPAQSSLFFSLSEAIAPFKRHIFCTQEPIHKISTTQKKGDEILFESMDLSFSALPVPHPFCPIQLPLDSEAIQWTFVSRSTHEEKLLKEKYAPPPSSTFVRGPFTSGLILEQKGIVSYAHLAKKPPIRRQLVRQKIHATPASFHELFPGDLVVHTHSGIGRFLGIEKQTNHLGVMEEFLLIQYAQESKLFVPLSQAHLISRYIGSEGSPPSLSQLGTKRWHAIRMKTQAEIVGYANDLLRNQAERVVQGGFAFLPDSKEMIEFEESFPYTETDDQLQAIAAIKQDMMQQTPMDRLVCGDVGYGKTEVAMRAAFKAVVDGGKQVAVLVPTTVLAMQHYETFQERMAGTPVRIETISRFHSAKQNKEILKKLETGSVDILIGTHRLLSQDVRFGKLGLIIIDEEQRFGVRAKEHLKKFKKGVDCLTLSATPIPRTLYMSIVHVKEMSLINTPPQDRLPVRVILAEKTEELIQNALLREKTRGGQSFYIHNRVETLLEKQQEIQALVPSLTTSAIHGQMPPDAIEEILHRFKEGKIDLLFATTIVENGIDIPNANTILVERADTYGLADLYQLKGRVGRWNRSAYAYFLTPPNRILPEIAQKRLSALAEAGGYGGGMKVAMRDLEIRGAGDLLGTEQSGQVASVGFHLYCQLLRKAIDAIRRKEPISFLEAKVEGPFDARLPENYIDDVTLRLELYHRFGETSSIEEIEKVFVEMEDRFGKAPVEALWLYHLARIRTLATKKKFLLVKFFPQTVLLEVQGAKEVEKQSFPLPKKGLTPLEAEEIFQRFAALK